MDRLVMDHDGKLELLKARLACKAALTERAKLEHALKLARMENSRLRTALRYALHTRDSAAAEADKDKSNLRVR
jgi:hypothetical protein